MYIHTLYGYIGLHYNNIYYVHIICDYPSDVHYINLKPCTYSRCNLTLYNINIYSSARNSSSDP